MLMTRARYPTSGSLGAIAAERHRRRGVVDAGTPGLTCRLSEGGNPPRPQQCYDSSEFRRGESKVEPVTDLS